MTRLELVLNNEQKEEVRRVITRVPRNEEEVKRIFFKLEKTLGFEDVTLYASSYPDASSFFRGKEIFMEFEYRSSEFRRHKHDEIECDLVICWEDDEGSLGIPVLELSTLADNWLEARQMAMLTFPFDQMSQKDIGDEQALMDRFNFDVSDAVSCKTGTTRQGVRRYYGSHWEKRTPECLGGPLECVRRDIEIRKADVGIDSNGIAPAVLCKECESKEQCTLGKETSLGYIFMFIADEKRPRRVTIRRVPIRDQKTLSCMKRTKHNPWKGVYFKRR